MAYRIREVLGGRPAAVVAREAGIPPSTLDSILKGTEPRASTLVRLAAVLDTSAEYLVTGRGGSARPIGSGVDLRDAADAGWVMLPRFDLFAWTPEGKPEPIELVPMRQDWLARQLRTASNLWLTQMPSESMPQIAHEGEPIICKDVLDRLVDGRTYIFMLDGQPIVRRVSVKPDGHLLTTGDGAAEHLFIPRDDMRAPDIYPVGRVLAAMRIRSV